MPTLLNKQDWVDNVGQAIQAKDLDLSGALSIVGTTSLGIVDLDSTAATLVSNAATLTKYAAVVTTESLTTAGGASQALTLTRTGVAAGDLALVQYAGGTNTTRNFTVAVVTSTNTVTVTVYNNTAATALNGTIIFNVWILKA